MSRCYSESMAVTMSDAEKAELRAKAALASETASPKPNKRIAQVVIGLLVVVGLLGLILQDEHKLAEAESMYRETLAIRRELLGKDDYGIAIALNSLCGVLTFEGKLAEAETASREALTITRKASGNDHIGLSNVMYNRGNVFFEQGHLSEAEGCFREAVALRRKSLGNNHEETAVALSGLASTLRHEQKFDSSVNLLGRRLFKKGAA